MRAFDRWAAWWERVAARRSLGTALAVGFLAAVAVIEINRQGWLPPAVAARIPTNHFAAVDLAFGSLLILEVLGLVLALADSVAASVGRQLQLLALILLRKAFMEFAEFTEPIVWSDVSTPVLHMVAYAVAALMIFVVLGFYYRVQLHQQITADEEEQQSFLAAKKTVAILLLGSFLALAFAYSVLHLLGRDPFDLFAGFYLVLIFTDVLIVLISQAYSSAFRVLFRNTGFALATVLMRLSLTAPAYVSGLLAVGSALFTLGLSLAYRKFRPVLRRSDEIESKDPS